MKFTNGQVTFRYKNSEDIWHTKTLDAEAFISRFLQHVLPKRFVKVRYYGLWHPQKRHKLECAKELLHFKPKVKEKSQETQSADPETSGKENNGFRCPKCGGAMVVVDQIKSQRRRAPPD
ncbi:MAG: transposase [bacterium]